MIVINEATRREIINRSKDSGKDRHGTRMSVDDKGITLGRVGMLELTAKSPHLDVYFEIHGYRSTIRIQDFTRYLQKNYRSGNYDLGVYKDVKLLVDISLKESIDRADLLVDCTCPDFRYRFAHVATINDFKFGDKENRPAKKTNPDNKGSICKHLARVLNIPSKWRDLVATAAVRAIRYDETIITGL